MNNKKSQAVFIGIMIFIMVVIVVVQFISPIKDQIILARSPPNLDCANTSITVGQKSTCIIVDFTLFYFVGMSLAAGAAFLGGKFIIERLKK